MVKTNTKNSHFRHRQPIYRRPIFWLAVIIIIAAGCGLYFWLNQISNPTPPDHSSLNAPHVDTSPTPEDSDSHSNSSTEVSDTKQPEDKVVRYDGQDPNTLDELTGFITRKSNVDGTLTVVASLDQYIHGSGTCTLTLTGQKYGKTYTATTNIIPEATNSLCEDFVIPFSTLGLPRDNYQITIQFNGGNKTGLIQDGVEL